MAIAGAQRKQVLKVLMISLLLDLVRNIYPHAATRILNKADILHLHPTTLPILAILLPRSRPLAKLPLEPYLPLPKRLQELLRQTDRLPL
jgi:hypothetical protein